MVTDTQWKLIEKKYGMLINKICHMISGDKTVTSYEDNLQDLRVSVMEAVSGFERQKGGVNGSFDDFWGSSGFDKYIKTCLWTKKNNKGAKVTKKLNVTKTVSMSEHEEILLISHNPTPALDDEIFLKEVFITMSDIQKNVIHHLVYEPNLIKPNGKTNIKKLSELLEINYYETQKEINELSDKLKNSL